MKNIGKKLIYIVISIIISVIVFNLIQTNRVYIKAVVKKDCTVTLNYTNFKNNSSTSYKRVFRYSDKVDKVKLRLKDNVKSMNITVEKNRLDIKKITIVSGIIPFKVKSLNISESTFRIILLERIIVSLLIGFIIPLLIYDFTKWIYYRKEKFMVAVFIFIFCLPVLTMALPLNKINVFNILGEREAYNMPKFSIKSFIDKSYQGQFENWFNQKIVWNALYIKMFNSLYYALFDKSYSSNGDLIIGKDKYLYERAYINSLYFPNPYGDVHYIPHLEKVKSDLDKMTKDMKEVQDYFESKGKTFIFVITPSKADFNGDKIPDRFEVGDVTYQEYLHKIFIKSLEKNGINYVDTPDYIKAHANGKPIFAPGGIHWNDLGKMLATQSIIDELNKVSKYKFDDVKTQKSFINKFPQNEDRDLVTLLNILYLPKNYSVETLIYEPTTKPAPKIKVKVVSGSFGAGFCDGLTQSHTFKYIDYYFYINRKLITYRDFLKQDVIEDESIRNVSKNIKAASDADIIILELNDSLIGAKRGHVQTFISEIKKIMAKDKK